ncbi:TRAP transporter small permease [Pseudomonadota bacterium]|jgi:TRAP-type C4-dicarboxylate transport system permease small subunit|nr:TRAP transporter small permease [Alphaproteobacteria bacterium]MDC1356210.1 TRAP transporter small permease [Pseudomonadota bacterium]|tara:strand:+ start:48 stop:581 length:534 start_codon:yes stop_codon:yes gene_type:complete
MSNRLQLFIKNVLFLERFIIVFFTVSMIGLYGLNVIVREITPQYASLFAWIDEASRILMVWVVFLSIGIAFDRGRHIAMTTFINSFSNKNFLYFGKIIDLLGFVFSLYCIWLGFKITIFVFNSGQVSPTLNIPMFILYVAPTLGFLLISIRYALSFLNFKNRFNLKHNSMENIKVNE